MCPRVPRTLKTGNGAAKGGSGSMEGPCRGVGAGGGGGVAEGAIWVAAKWAGYVCL